MTHPTQSSKQTLAAFFYAGSMIFYGLGLYYPIMSSKTSILGFTLEENTLRLIDTIELFWEKNDFFLATVIFVFTIVFPIVKYFDLGVRLFFPKLLPKKLVQVLKDLDKWSMLDVFLVALLIVNFKLDTSFLSMELRSGTTFIALSVMFRMLTSHFIDKGHNQNT